MIKEIDIDTVVDKLNSFDPNFGSTVGKFEDGFIKYYGIKVVSYQIPMYNKYLYTRQNMHFNICAPWFIKTAGLKLYFEDRNENSFDDNNKKDTPVIDFRLPFTEINGKQFSKNFWKKLRRFLKIKIKYIVMSNTRFIISIEIWKARFHMNKNQLYKYSRVFALVERLLVEQKDG